MAVMETSFDESHHMDKQNVLVQLFLRRIRDMDMEQATSCGFNSKLKEQENFWTMYGMEDFIREEGKLPLHDISASSKAISCEKHHKNYMMMKKATDSYIDGYTSPSKSPLRSPLHDAMSIASDDDDNDNDDDDDDDDKMTTTYSEDSRISLYEIHDASTRLHHQDADEKPTTSNKSNLHKALGESLDAKPYLSWKELKDLAQKGKMQMGSLLLLQGHDDLYTRSRNLDEVRQHVNLQSKARVAPATRDKKFAHQECEWDASTRRKGLSNSRSPLRDGVSRPSRMMNGNTK